MLEEFWVDNFKSLINLTFKPAEQNLLLGKNNAGKTNLCQAMCLVAATASMPLDTAADSVAGGRVALTNHYFSKKTMGFRVRATVPFEAEDLSFQYNLELSVRNSPSGVTALEVDTEKLVVTGEAFDGVTLLENTRQGVRLLHEAKHVAGRGHYAETSAPRDATMLQRLYDLQTNPRASCFKKYLMFWQHYTLSLHMLRQYQHTPNLVALNPNGSNLASVVYHLKTGNERHYRKLLSKLKTIEPKIDAINFFGPAEGTIVMFFEDAKGNRIPVANASDGTLRFLALTYALLSQPSFAPASLVIVEEPENGLYVGCLKELLDSIRDVDTPPQVLFTSHSPYFIDLFDDRIEGVFLMSGGEEHSTITQPDVAQVTARLEIYPLGEQHFREMLH